MLNVKTINDLELGKIEISINRKYNGDRIDLSLKVLEPIDIKRFVRIVYDNVKNKIHYSNIVAEPVRVFKRDVYEKVIYIPMFKKNIELCRLKDKKIYRLYSQYPDLAVSNEGIIYNIWNDLDLPISMVDYIKYPIVRYNNIVKVVHRIVAFTWVDNDDYIKKYVVDHIDGNKNNYHASNLRWLSNVSNIARSTFTNTNSLDKRYGVYSSKLNKTLDFTSLKQIEDFFKIPYRTINALTFPQIRKVNDDVIIIEDYINFNNWKLKDKLSDYGYRYKVIGLNTTYVKRFKRLDEILKEFKLPEHKFNKNKNGSIENDVRDYLADRDYLLKILYTKKVYNQNSKNKYTILAKDLDTGNIIEEGSTRLLGLKLGTNKSNIIFRLNQNKKAGLPLLVGDKKYLISRSDMEWPKLRSEPYNKNKRILDKETGKIYSSIRSLANDTNINRGKINKILEEPNSKYMYI